MGINSDLYYCAPRKLDDNALEHMIINSYDTEQKRRRRTCDDEFREEVFATKEYQRRPTGEFMYADLSFFDLFNKEYANRYGEFIPMDRGYQCPHCYTCYPMAYPPLHCRVCGYETPMGRYVKDGYYKQ